MSSSSNVNTIIKRVNFKKKRISILDCLFKLFYSGRVCFVLWCCFYYQSLIRLILNSLLQPSVFLVLNCICWFKFDLDLKGSFFVPIILLVDVIGFDLVRYKAV